MFLMLLIKNKRESAKSEFQSVLLAKAILILALLLALFSSNVYASESCSSTESSRCIEENTFQFGLSVGLGLVTNPLNQSDNVPLVLLPSVSFYSGNFFIENLDFGYTLHNSEQTSVSIIASPSYDSIFFNRWDPGNIFVELAPADSFSTPSLSPSTTDRETIINPNELSSRDFSYLGGLEYSFEWDKQLLQVTALNDITSTHSGSEIRFAYQYKATQHIRATAGFTWKDKKLTDYYYGIDEDEIIDNRAVYSAGSSFNPFVRATYNKPLEDGDSLRVSIQYQKLDSEISQSPVVADDYVITFFAGRNFSF